MRAAVFVVVLAGCGRFGFGESDPTDASGSNDAAIDAIDGAIDAPPGATPQFCSERVLATLPLGGSAGAVAIRAVALSTGYAVAIETTDASIPLLELDDAAQLVAMHQPFASGYAPLFGISKHNDRPVVFLETGGVGYLKHVDPGWDSYTTGVSGAPMMIDPAYAELSSTSGFSARTSIGILEVGRTDDPDASSFTATDYAPSSVVTASLSPIPGGARVVVEKSGGVCETFRVGPSGQTTDLHTFSPCYAPKVAADATSGVIVHRTDAAGPYAVHVIPAVPTDLGTTYSLTGATMARAAVREDGAYWVGHGSGSYRALMRIAPSGAMTESRENVASYLFDLTTKDAFWIEGATVHVSTPCLR